MDLYSYDEVKRSLEFLVIQGFLHGLISVF